MKSNYYIFFIIIIHILAFSTKQLSTFEDYIDIPKQNLWSHLFMEAQRKNQKPELYMPFFCYEIKENLLSKIDKFIAKIREYKKRSNFIIVAYNYIVGQNLTTLKKLKKAAQFKAYYLFWKKGTEIKTKTSDQTPKSPNISQNRLSIERQTLSPIINQQENESDSGDIHQMYRFIDKIDDLPEDIEDDSGIIFDEDNFDYKIIGKTLAELLFKDEFICLSIPEISLLIFKLFYLKIFPRKYLKPLLEGVFIELYEKSKENSENKIFHEHTFLEFYGFNLNIILGSSGDFADNLFKLFMKNKLRDGIEETLENFIQLYDYGLSTIELYENESDETKANFVKKILAFDKKAIKKVVVNGSFLAVVYSVHVLKSKLFGEFCLIANVMISTHTDFVWESVLNKVRSYLPSADYEDVELREKIELQMKNSQKSFNIKNLADFLTFFEKQVENHSECAMCRVTDNIKKFKAFEEQGDVMRMII